MVKFAMNRLLTAAALVLLTGCASLPDIDLRAVPAGRALVYGSAVGLHEERGYSVVLIRKGPDDEVTEVLKAVDWDQDTQKGFVWTLVPGEYELYRYSVTAQPDSGIRSSFGYWVSAKGYQQSLDLGRKATEAEFRAFDHDTFRVEAGKLYYVGEWRLQPGFPVINDNRARSDRLVSDRYPRLDLSRAVTLIPNITGAQLSDDSDQ
jgi:hypothetical protein